jgi:chlorobactene glucosyltransferase
MFMETFVNGFMWLTFFVWCVLAILTRAYLKSQPPREVSRSKRDKDYPLVSILIPARNEENRVLKSSIPSILSQDYSNFEVIAVNDRSTDSTGPILNSFASRDRRLRVIHGETPPEGWIGKTYALEQAFRASKGEWILATDADILYHPAALRTAVDVALEHDCDSVTFIPYIECLSFWEKVFMPTFAWYMLLSFPPHKVNDPDSKVSLGVGGFFLIKRRFLERVGGYEKVKADVAEDLRMAEILKSYGARLRLEYAPELIRTRMQTNLREIWEGFSKNMFAGAKFSPALALAGSMAVLLFVILPPVTGLLWLLQLYGVEVVGHLAGFLVWVLQVFTFALTMKTWDVPARYSLTTPLGHILMLSILINSAVRVITGVGVRWKGQMLYSKKGVSAPRQ